MQKKIMLITYCGCTAAPGDNYGAPVRVAPPSDALPASFALARTDDLGNAARHRSPAGQTPDGRETDRIR